MHRRKAGHMMAQMILKVVNVLVGVEVPLDVTARETELERGSRWISGSWSNMV